MNNLQISRWPNLTCEFWRTAFFVFVSMILTAEGGLAQSSEGLKVVGYREFIAPTQVSGHAIVGLTTVPVGGDQKQDTLYVYFEKEFKGSIKLEVATADGYLRGEGEFSGFVPAKTWEKVSIRINRDERAQLARERGGPETLAVKAQIDQPNAPLVVHWGENPPAGRNVSLRLYVNSRRAELFVRGPNKVVQCKQISGMTPVRFDKICDISSDYISKDGKVTLVRRDGFESELVPLVIPWSPN